MRYSLQPSRRHPLIRALSLLLGLALIGVVLIGGLLVASVLLIGGAILMVIRQRKRGQPVQPLGHRPTNQHRPQIVEGEFVVLRQGHSSGR